MIWPSILSMEISVSWTMTQHEAMVSTLTLQFSLHRPTGSDRPLLGHSRRRCFESTEWYRLKPGREDLLHLRHRIGVFQPPPAVSGYQNFNVTNHHAVYAFDVVEKVVGRPYLTKQKANLRIKRLGSRWVESLQRRICSGRHWYIALLKCWIKMANYFSAYRLTTQPST